MKERRGHWYLLTGLLLGLAFGLLYAWVLNPIAYIDTTPKTLSQEYKDHQRVLIASAYAATDNLGRARARLEELDGAGMYTAIAAQAQQALSDGTNPDVARLLGLLSVALGQVETPLTEMPSSPPAPSPTTLTLVSMTTLEAATSPTPSPSHTSIVSGPTSTGLAQGATLTPPPATQPPTPTATQRPSPTPSRTLAPSPTPGAPYVLDDQASLCETRYAQPLLQVIALDAAGNGVSGVEVIVTWPGGVDRFFTGLKPELGPGYADFTLTPDQVYSVRLGEGGEIVPDIAALSCPEASGALPWGAVRLTFSQP